MIDNNSNVGTAAKRWKLVRAVTITSGDIGFDDPLCVLCKRVFEEDQNLVLHVIRVEMEKGGRVTKTVPVHEHCRAPSGKAV